MSSKELIDSTSKQNKLEEAKGKIVSNLTDDGVNDVDEKKNENQDVAIKEEDDQKIQPNNNDEGRESAENGNNMIYVILTAIIVILIALLVSPEPKIEPVTLHCPAKTYYAQIPLKYYKINASHPDHKNEATSYHWNLIKKTSKEHYSDAYDKETSTLKFDALRSEGQYDFELELSAQISKNKMITKECKVTVLFVRIPQFSIDLGTTFSCIAYRNSSKQIEIVTLKEEKLEKLEDCVPTAIYFPKDPTKGIEFGYEALEHLTTDPENVIFDVKRIVGRHRNESEVQQFIETHEFKLSDDEYPKIIIPNWNNMQIIPEQALAAILVYLVNQASRKFDSPYSQNIVISIPAFFHNGPRKGVRSACHIAGLNPQKLVVEPSAAALAFMKEAETPHMNGVAFLVFDFGGGTLDCSIARCRGIDCRIIAVSGDPALGGIDFDNIIKNIIIDKLHDKGVDISSFSKKDRAKISQRAELFKIALSKDDNYCEPIWINDNNHQVCISRTYFKKHSTKLVERAVNTAQNVFETYFKSNATLKHILLVGGTSKMPMIEEALKLHFGGIKSLQIMHPKRNKEHMVVAGGAIIADRLECENTDTNCPARGITDVVPLSLGFATCVGHPKEFQLKIVDLVYVIDATYSMDIWIKQVKEDINKLITDMTSEFPGYSFRIAGVAYRDWDDIDPPHMQHIDFTDNIEKFRNWLKDLKAEGGGKTAEDVLGGLNKATELSWNEKSAVKLVIHIGDAPPHHVMYHNRLVTDEWESGYDGYHGYPKDPENYHQVVLNKFHKLGVKLMIVKLTNVMKIMINVFKSYASTINMRIYEEDLSDLNTKQATKKLLPKSEHILIEEMGNIKLASTGTAYSEDSANYTGKYECGIMDIVIPKNEPYPIKRTKKYCTHNPNSTEAKFQLYEGDERNVINNYFLANITITNVPKGSCKTAMIDVTFDIDRDGIATIKATINTTMADEGSEIETGCDSGSCIMSLGVLSKDGTLSEDDMINYRKMMVNWFSTDAIQAVLNK